MGNVSQSSGRESGHAIISRIHFDATKAPPFMVLEQRKQVMLNAIRDQNAYVDKRVAANPDIDESVWTSDASDDEVSSGISCASDHSREEDNPEMVKLYTKLGSVKVHVELNLDFSPYDGPHALGSPRDLLSQLELLDECVTHSLRSV